MANKARRAKRLPPSTHRRRCPKCDGEMLRGSCTKCNYSAKTAYRSRREAKESTFAAD